MQHARPAIIRPAIESHMQPRTEPTMQPYIEAHTEELVVEATIEASSTIEASPARPLTVLPTLLSPAESSHGQTPRVSPNDSFLDDYAVSISSRLITIICDRFLNH